MKARARSAARWLLALALALVVTPATGGAGAQNQIVLKLASTAPPGSPLARQLEALARYLGEQSQGRVLVKLFAAGTLGDDAELLERTRAGTLQAYAGTLDAFDQTVPSLQVLGAPYLFDGYGNADKALDGAVRKALAPQLEEAQLLFGMWGPSEFRAWYTSSAPLLSPAQAAGLTAPSPRSALHETMLGALKMRAGGAQLRPMLPAIVGAQTREPPPQAFDATLLEAAAASFDRGAQHVALSRHSLQASIVVYSARWFSGLPEALKKVLRHAPKSIVAAARKRHRSAAPLMKRRLQRIGVQLHKHSPAQRRAFAKALQPAVAAQIKALGTAARALERAAR